MARESQTLKGFIQYTGENDIPGEFFFFSHGLEASVTLVHVPKPSSPLLQYSQPSVISYRIPGYRFC